MHTTHFIKSCAFLCVTETTVLASPGNPALRAEHSLAFTPVLIYMSEIKVLSCLPLKLLNVTEIGGKGCESAFSY